MAASLNGKMALVTGAASGIGRACAERLAAEGASVLLTDVQHTQGEAVAAGIRATGAKATFMAHDVTQESVWADVISTAQSEFGGLHILVNNAGIGKPAPLTETTMEHWRLLFSINLDGMFLGMKHAIPLITNSGGGSIINLSSAAAMKAYANMSAYCASKAGVRQMTKVAALECAQNKTGIRVNSIHPGMIRTPAWDGLAGLEAPGEKPVLDDMAAATVPMGYVGAPSDIANAVVFLASDQSSYITGIELLIDGGQSIA